MPGWNDLTAQLLARSSDPDRRAEIEFWSHHFRPADAGSRLRRKRRHAPRPPDGLKTAAQAAAKLGCSTKTLDGYVRTGALKYVAIGHGSKRSRKMFTDADLNDFIANQTRKDTPACPSSAGRARPTGIMTSGAEVIDFAGPRKPGPGARRRR